MMNARNRIGPGAALSTILAILILPVAFGAAGEDSSERIASLIEALGATSSAERDEAFDALETYGDEARDALERARSTKDPRVSAAVTRLLERLEEPKQGRLRLKNRFAAPPVDGETEGRPQFPRPRPFPELEGSDQAEWDHEVDEWNREWNADIRRWNSDVEAWVNRLMGERGAGSGFTVAPGSRGSVRSFSSSGGASSRSSMSVDEEGRVTVKVTRDEDGETHEETIEADSMEAFEAEHPELAAELDLGFRPFEGGFRFGFSPNFDRRMKSPALPQVVGPRLGVQISTVAEDDPLRAHVALDPGIGLLVAEVILGSLAERLGVRKNDIIVEVGGVAVGEPEDVRSGLIAQGGEDAEVVVVRLGTRRVLEIR